MSLSNKYIYSLRKKFHGENIFILGSAPSIKDNNLELLRNKYTFGINSSTILAIENNFVQTFYILTDDLKDDQLLKTIDKDNNTIYDYGTKFLNKDTIRFVPKFLYKYDSEKIEEKRTFYFNMKASINKEVFINSFSNNILNYVNRFYMTPTSAIEISAFLGFKNIFLLGIDCIYPKSGSHFYNNSTLEYTDEEIKKIKRTDDFCLWVYYASKKIYKNNQRIFCCSKYSKLNNLIEYVSFKDAILKY